MDRLCAWPKRYSIINNIITTIIYNNTDYTDGKLIPNEDPDGEDFFIDLETVLIFTTGADQWDLVLVVDLKSDLR